VCGIPNSEFRIPNSALSPHQDHRRERDTGPSHDDWEDPFEALLAVQLADRHDNRHDPEKGVEEENEKEVVRGSLRTIFAHRRTPDLHPLYVRRKAMYSDYAVISIRVVAKS
jgi:hypothetical protein